MISLDEYVVKCDDLAWREYDGEVVIMSEDGSRIHSLNKVASLIWELADGKVKISDIITRVCDRFDVQESMAQVDTLEFIQQLIDKHLLQLNGMSLEFDKALKENAADD